MKKIIFLFSSLVVACTSTNPNSTAVRRQVANTQACKTSEGLLAIDKQKEFFSRHQKSMADVFQKINSQGDFLIVESALKGGKPNQKYVFEFIGSAAERGGQAAQALLATSKFLSPNVNESLGYRSLKPTFQHQCELFEEDQVKKVHALGTLAIGHMNVYEKLKELDARDQKTGREIQNPWTGLLGSSSAGGIPLLLRFSIANPVGPTIGVGDKSLSLEFIPGLGLKFLIDHQKSVDLVAMDSLAGQGTDHNFFKYEFSPDFSAQAPKDFNTAQGTEKKQNLGRYNRNPVNAQVMGLVGKRFFDVIPHIMNVKASDLDPHSTLGPHPFIIDIQPLAAFDKNGNSVAPESQKRPWRLVFKPALDNIDIQRRSQILDKVPYTPGKLATDFRAKLAHLQPGDRVYYVIGESRDKKRYIIGEIILDSSVSPSEFADKIYFIQHRLDTTRAFHESSFFDANEN